MHLLLQFVIFIISIFRVFSKCNTGCSRGDQALNSSCQCAEVFCPPTNEEGLRKDLIRSVDQRIICDVSPFLCQRNNKPCP